MSFDRLPLTLALSVTILAGTMLRPMTAGAYGASRLLPQSTLGYVTKSSDQSAANAEFFTPIYIASKDNADSSKSAPSTAGSATVNSDAADTLVSGKDDKDGKKAKAAKKAAKDDEKKNVKADKINEKEKEKEKESAKKDQEKEGDKKKEKKGMFGGKHAEAENNAKNSKDKSEAKTEAKVGNKKESVSRGEAKAAPAFVPDDALISVLKDINRALADGQSEPVAKIENVNRKMILGLAQEIYTKALTEPDLAANRILARDNEHQARTQLIAESWSSGNVEVSDKLRGSMAAVWAKRIGGLVTVTIAGDAGERKTPDGAPIGEFMVVITGHSPVQKGFDIQSQGDVTFWMGKLNDIVIEANCVPTEAAGEKVENTSNADTTSPSSSSGEAKKKLITSLSPLLTNRYRNHYAVLLAADIESQKVLAGLARAADPDSHTTDTEETATEHGNEATSAKDGRVAASGDESSAAPKQGHKSASEEKANKTTLPKKVEQRKVDIIAGTDTTPGAKITLLASNNASITAAAVDSTATAAAVIDAGPHFHLPSASSTLLMPDKALAGQNVTVALLDRSRLPEANVELSFNGNSLTTDEAGQVVYQIPEDATPGRSLNIALSSRPDEIPATIEVFQPLNVTSGQAPRMDRISPLAVKNSVMTVEGHNFDGLARNNTVIVDGSLDGKIISASPFQIKLLLPENLTPGPHSLCVSTDGMRSNLGGFDYADTQVSVEGKDNGKENSNIKLIVKVVGTTAKMNVKILNQTPDVIRLNRGAEITVTSSGGYENTILLPAVRGKKGPFKIDTQLEM